jgi:probable HAF family extracellular repeat protein
MEDLQITKGILESLAINNSGVVVGTEATSDGPNRAFVWDKFHGARDLNSLVPSNLGVELRQATAVNDQGQIVANGYDGSTWHAYLLQDTDGDGDFLDLDLNLKPQEVTDLGTLRRGTSSTAYAINDVGQVAGISGGNAFLWQNGVMKSLGQFHQEAPNPTGINLSSVVVGYTLNHGAWVWTGSGKIQGLTDLIPSNSGWSLLAAKGINDAGTIVGSGIPHSGAQQHAFLVTRTSAPVATVTTSTAGLTPANTLSLAPLEAGARSPHPLADAPHWTPGPRDSPILIALTPASDQDLTPFVTELIRPGTKRPRPSFWG